MKKLFLTMVAMVMSLASYAQWTKPATPTAMPLTVGAEVYLYNLDAEGFLCGANDWGTRASIEALHGHKIWIQKLESDDVAWDGKSYFISNFIEQGGMANQVGCMFISDAWNFWVDRAMNAAADANQGFYFVEQGANIYKIQPSDHNQDLQAQNFPDNYIGMRPVKDDSRLYLNIPEVDGTVEADAWYTRWIFIASADYQPFVDEMIRYNAAVALGEAIEKALAENDGIDIKEVQDVYGNTASTTEELQKASSKLTELVLAFQTARVSVDTPADYTPYITNPSYENNNNEGWSGDAPVFQTYGNAERYWGNLNHYQQLPELPAGVYRVQVTGFYRAGWNEVDAERYQTGESEWQKAKVFVDGCVWNHQVALPLQNSGASEAAIEGSTDAQKTNVGYVPNNMQTADIYVKAGQYKPTTVSTILSEGQRMTIGIKKTETFDGDWLIWDDWKLYYLGASKEAYQLVVQEVLAGSTDYEQLVANEENIYFQKSVYEAYVAAKNALTNAATGDEIASAIGAFQTAYDALGQSIAAYAAYYEAYNEAKDWVETMASGSDEAGQLADYVYSEETTGYNGHGGALYILNEGPLTAEEVKAEKAYLEKLLADAVASGMKDGDDCTSLLKNPTFADDSGWTASVGPQFHYENLNLLLGHNMVFDVYQELTGLQNGLYEFSYNGFYRPGDPGGFDQGMADAAKCYAYINNYETRVPGILDDMSDEPIGESNYTYEEGKYYPNSAATVAEYFKAGKYAAHAYGLVTDGTMRIGFKNNLRVADGSEAWFGPVRLIFRAKNAEALHEVLSITLVTVDGMKDNYCGMPELNAMNDAADDAVNAADEELYNALIALKKTIEDVELSTAAYQKMQVALFNLEQAIANNTAASAATIAEAQALFDKSNDAYLGQEYTAEEAEEATAEMNAMVVKILFPSDEASEENPVDYTSAIVNNNFDPARGSKNDQTIEGWTTTAMNGYKEYTVSYNRTGFELNQKLTGLPKGKYKVTVHTYYRAGYYDEEETRVKNGEETHLTTLYAQTSEDKFTTKVKNLYEDATDEPVDGVKCYTLSNGKYAPDGTTPTAAYFKAGYYLNELVFTVPEDGEVTIGLSKTESFANDYEVVGEWNLWYMGDVKPSEENPVDYSSIIVNPTFDPARGSKNDQTIEGWTTTAMNGYKEYTVSYNRAPFELYQKLTGLPKGKYMVTVHTYYRAGYYDEEETRVKNGEETHLTTLYAQTSEDKFTTKVMNLYEDATDEPVDGVKCYTLSNGKYAPDGTSPTAAYFKAGYYLNELRFTVPEDGEVTIGLSKIEMYANDYEVVGEWKLWYMGDSEEGLEEKDMSSLIVNNTFDPARGSKNDQTIEGWVTSAMNGYKEYTVSYNRAPIDLYQDLTGLPEGTYKVTVHTYYRAGYYDEEENRVKNGEDTHLTTFYARTSDEEYSKKVMNLYEDATDEPVDGVKCYTLSNGKYAPDGTSPTAAYFKAGYYLNELPFYVSNDGSVRIGLKKTEVLANDYEVVGEWNLYYYGSGNNIDLLTGIEGIVSEAWTEAMPVGIYSLNGIRLSTFQRGINIIRMADGSVRKVMIK